MAEATVPAPEPVRRPTLSPDPEQIWRPSPRRAQEVEAGPLWRHLEPAKVVLALMALAVVTMIILLAVLFTGG